MTHRLVKLPILILTLTNNCYYHTSELRQSVEKLLKEKYMKSDILLPRCKESRRLVILARMILDVNSRNYFIEKHVSLS